MATTQVRFSENVADGGIGRSPAPQTIASKKSSKEKGSGSSVANFMRGAGQKLGGMLRFDKQDGQEKVPKGFDAYLTDSARIRDRSGREYGRDALYS
ncbi:hypothetical protein NMY22_g7071 [Coprinellus aureogranulatus]|nr:hypothetical protein NMY22_g7071 [Coprinellus aureogranulatus]